MSRLYLREGEEITCEERGHVVAKANKNHYTGDVAPSSGFDWIAMPNPGPGSHKCSCGGTFMMSSIFGIIVHVKDGWRAGDNAELVRAMGKKVSKLPHD